MEENIYVYLQEEKHFVVGNNVRIPTKLLFSCFKKTNLQRLQKGHHSAAVYSCKCMKERECGMLLLTIPSKDKDLAIYSCVYFNPKLSVFFFLSSPKSICTLCVQYSPNTPSEWNHGQPRLIFWPKKCQNPNLSSYPEIDLYTKMHKNRVEMHQLPIKRAYSW